MRGTKWTYVVSPSASMRAFLSHPHLLHALWIFSQISSISTPQSGVRSSSYTSSGKMSMLTGSPLMLLICCLLVFFVVWLLLTFRLLLFYVMIDDIKQMKDTEWVLESTISDFGSLDRSCVCTHGVRGRSCQNPSYSFTFLFLIFREQKINHHKRLT